MAEAGLGDLIIAGLYQGVECSLEQLRGYEEFAGLSLLKAIDAIDAKLASVGLCIQPPTSEGEVDEIRFISRIPTPEVFESAMQESLATLESQLVEFKESLYVRKKVFGNEKVPKEHWVSEDIVFEVISTICSFLNADGGTLLIGVADGGEVVGIDCELDYVKGADGTLDRWELFLSNCLQKYIFDFNSCVGYISRKIVNQDGKNVCVVKVTKRRTALSVCRSPTDPTAELVFVRNGNGKLEIKARALEELIKARLAG